MDPFIGQIMMFAGNFAPRGWALCNGQLLPISQNQALFAILGTTYGGNGSTTFALPNLMGRSPVHVGQGAGFSNIQLGQMAGTEMHTISIAEMPNHRHDGSALTLGCNEEDGNSGEAKGRDFGIAGSGTPYNSNGSSNAMATKIAGNTGAAGQGQSFNTRSPYLGVNFVIALEGIFPPRD